METVRLDVSKAPPAIAEALERVQQGAVRCVAVRDGVPVAAVISLPDLALFEELLAELGADVDVEKLRADLATRARAETSAPEAKKPARRSR